MYFFIVIEYLEGNERGGIFIIFVLFLSVKIKD